MWRIAGLERIGTQQQDGYGDTLHSQRSPAQKEKTGKNKVLGSFFYKLGPADQLRFSTHANVKDRLAVHAGNALMYNEYDSHVAMLLEVSVW